MRLPPLLYVLPPALPLPQEDTSSQTDTISKRSSTPSSARNSRIPQEIIERDEELATDTTDSKTFLPIKGLPPSNGFSAIIIVLVVLIITFVLLILGSAIVQSRRKVRKRIRTKQGLEDHLAIRETIQHTAYKTGAGSTKRYFRLGPPPPLPHGDPFTSTSRSASCDQRLASRKLQRRVSSIRRHRSDLHLERSSDGASPSRSSTASKYINIPPRKSLRYGALYRRQPNHPCSRYPYVVVDPVKEESEPSVRFVPKSPVETDPLNAASVAGPVHDDMDASIKAVVTTVAESSQASQSSTYTLASSRQPSLHWPGPPRKSRTSLSAPVTTAEKRRVDSFSWREVSRSPTLETHYDQSQASSLNGLEPLRSADEDAWQPSRSVTPLARSTSWSADDRCPRRLEHAFI